jgi:hypothetical protein
MADGRQVQGTARAMDLIGHYCRLQVVGITHGTRVDILQLQDRCLQAAGHNLSSSMHISEQSTHHRACSCKATQLPRITAVSSHTSSGTQSPRQQASAVDAPALCRPTA